MSKFLSREEFIDKANMIHNCIYDYSRLVYLGSRNKVDIICRKHGLFQKRADRHLFGQGCPKCALGVMTNEDFINKCNNIHNNKYDYTKTNFVNSRTKIIITCPIHGDFEQNSDNHLHGSGCSKCGDSKKGVTKSLDYYLNKAIKIHNNKYDYSKIIFINSKLPVTIICPIHGDFEQVLQQHVTSEHGCPECAKERTEFKRKTTDSFINKSKIIHKDLYNYDLTEYIGSTEKVKIICKKHGVFEQLPSNHLSGNGCPKCNYSKGELLIHNWLVENNIKFKSQFKVTTPEIARNSNLIIVDFFVKHNDKQYFIEYDGMQHYEYVEFFHKTIEDFEKQQRRDKVLNDFCELHKDKVTLIRFKYTQSKENILKELKEKINVH